MTDVETILDAIDFVNYALVGGNLIDETIPPAMVKEYLSMLERVVRGEMTDADQATLAEWRLCA
jgi:hypothetical protein